MHTLDDARAAVAQAATPLPARELPLLDAVGCRLAAAPLADVDLPPDDVSAMDGYAVRAADLDAGGPLPVAFEVAAGAVPEPLPTGHAARIFTGALLPAGADAVVMQEQAERDGDTVRFTHQPRSGEHVRRGGEVFAVGQPLAETGDALTPQRIALLAAGGAAQVSVRPQPRIAILATGSELVASDATPARGQIRDSNSTMLAAFARAAGYTVASRATVGDDGATLQSALNAALEVAELVICSGGVSVGDHDLVPGAVREAGGEVLVHGVAMKPGKPILVARIMARGVTRWVVGLPGNAVSAMAGWRLFAWPLAQVLAGNPDALAEAPRHATMSTTTENRNTRELLLPARVASNSATIEPLFWKGSHDLYTTADANALMRIPPGETARVGDSVLFFPL